jgi:hypothetical protein
MSDTLYLRADFAGLAIASVRVNALASAYWTGPMVERYTVDSADIYPSPPAVCRMHSAFIVLVGTVPELSLAFST